MSLAKAVQATDGAKGFDTNTPLTNAAADFANAGYDFCVRYVSRRGRRGSNDLTRAEVNAIIESGLGLMVVQHVAPSGWQPSGQLGELYGERAVTYVNELGLPKQMNVWLDLEGVLHGTAHQDIVNYCNEWYIKVASAGYTPGIYIGSNSFMSSSQLYLELKFKHYWKSMSRVPAPSNRGYQMFQIANPARRTRAHYGEYFENGVWIDKDVIHKDNGTSGSLPIWAIKDDGGETA